MAFRVLFFATKAGNEPVRDWLRELSKEDRSVIGADLRTVQIGFPLGMPLCRPLGDGLYEVRSSLPGKKEARIVFFQRRDRLIIVAGFIKKTQQTPKNEIDVASARKRQYLEGENG